MQFIISKQIAVEAETPEEAVAKINEGNTISLNVQQRPQPQVVPQGIQTSGQFSRTSGTGQAQPKLNG